MRCALPSYSYMLEMWYGRIQELAWYVIVRFIKNEALLRDFDVRMKSKRSCLKNQTTGMIIRIIREGANDARDQ